MLEGYGSPDSRIYEEIRINLRHRLRHVTLTFFTKPLKCLSYKRGGMAERLNALVLKREHKALYSFTPYLNPFKSTLKIS